MKLFLSGLSAGGSIPVITPNYITNFYFDDTERILDVRGNIRVRKTNATTIETSLNNGISYDYSYTNAIVSNFSSCQILNNGNILFTGRYGNMYLTNTTLSFMTEKKAYLDGGAEWNTPTGEFKYFQISKAKHLSDTNMFVFGNYILYADGGTAIFYTTDYGVTIKVAKDFTGKDNNPRHIHNVEYNKYEDKWVMLCGDNYGENAMWEGDYDTINDTWIWTRMQAPIGDVQNPELKTVDCQFIQHNGETYMYWGADVEYGLSQFYGVWRVKWSERNDRTKFQRVINTSTYVNMTVCLGMSISSDNVITAVFRIGEWSESNPNDYYFVMAKETFTTYPLPFETQYITTFNNQFIAPVSISSKLSDGTYLLYTYDTENYVDGFSTTWIKPGLDLFIGSTNIKP